jgi:hypothetical protein
MDAPTTESIAQRLAIRRREICPMPSDTFSGRGLVICAGGPRIFTNAYVLIHVLRRHLDCRLPIEVWHFGPEELSPRMADILCDLEVQPVDASAAMRHRPPQLSNPWQLKPYAIKWSQFREVLYLDADQVPVRDPAELFGWSQYQEKGAVFWPDIIDLLADNPIWKICNLPPRRTMSIESGQLLFDKSRHWASLDLALALNEEAQSLYKYVYGDKDTFLLGAMMSGSDYALIPGRPKTDVPWCLYQCDFAGEVIFQHRTGAKWNFKGIQQELPQFSHREACETALNELRRKWNGRVFQAPSQRKEMQETEERLTGQTFRLSRPGEKEEMLQFLAGGEIKSSQHLQPANWFCDEMAEGPALFLTLGFSEALCFKRGSRGWQADDILLCPEDAKLQPTVQGMVRELVAATGFPSPISLLRLKELTTALNLLHYRGIDISEEIMTLAGEYRSGLAHDQLVALANFFDRDGDRPPDLHLPAEWNVILSRYTRKQPE